MRAPARNGNNKQPLLVANFWFTSTVPVLRCRTCFFTPDCFFNLWPVLCQVTPLLRGRIRNLTQQDVGDLLFSLSREFSRVYTGLLYDT